jgi:hypothetical protein
MSALKLSSDSDCSSSCTLFVRSARRFPFQPRLVVGRPGGEVRFFQGAATERASIRAQVLGAFMHPDCAIPTQSLLKMVVIGRRN